jgi:hypothetical protein
LLVCGNVRLEVYRTGVAGLTGPPAGQSSNTSGTEKVMMLFPAAVAMITSL